MIYWDIIALRLQRLSYLFGSFAEPRRDEWDSEPRYNGELKDGNEKTCEENSMIEVLAKGPSLNIGCGMEFILSLFFTNPIVAPQFIAKDKPLQSLWRNPWPLTVKM